jgi:putative membrane protein
MERRLFGIIMTPAMIVTWLTGAGLVWVLGAGGVTGFAWFWIKICAVFILSLLHARFGWHARQFAIGLNQHSARYFRIINEIPAVLAVIAVIMVVMKPS